MRPCSSTCLARATGVCTEAAMRSIAGSSNTISALCGMPGSPTMLLRADAPVDNHLGLPALGQSRGRLELRDQQFWRVNLRDHQNVAEARGHGRRLRRRLIGRLRLQRDGRALTVNLQTERKTRDGPLGTIIDAPGRGLARAPGIDGLIDLRGRIEPERAPRRGRDDHQHGHDEDGPKAVLAKDDGGIGHAGR